MKRLLVAWGPATLWAAVLFYLSAQSFRDGRPPLEINDKLVHGILFGVLGGLLAWGRTRAGGTTAHGVLLVLGLLYALSDEFHQRFVPGRTPSGWDLLADGIGLVAGYAVVTRWIAAREA